MDVRSAGLLPLALIAGVGLLAAALASLWLPPRLRGAGWRDEPRPDRLASRTTSRAGGPAWIAGVAAGICGWFAAGLVGLAGLAGLAGSDGGPAGGSAIAPATPPGPAGGPVDAGRVGLVALLLLGAGFGSGRRDDRGRLGSRAKLVWLAFLPLGGLLLTLPPGAWWSVRLVLALPASLLVAVALQVFDNHDAALASVLLSGSVAAIWLVPGAAPVAAAAAGASLALLAWNWPPARLYFGNGGSMAAGVLVAWLLLVATLSTDPAQGGSSDRSVWLAFLPFAWPAFDLGFVVVSRLRRGLPPWQGGTDHTAHRLARRIGTRATACVLLAVSGLLALAAIGLRRGAGPH